MLDDIRAALAHHERERSEEALDALRAAARTFRDVDELDALIDLLIVEGRALATDALDDALHDAAAAHLHRRNALLDAVGNVAADARACSLIARRANDLDDVTLSHVPYHAPATTWVFDDAAAALLLERALHERPRSDVEGGSLRFVVLQMFGFGDARRATKVSNPLTQVARAALVDACVRQPVRAGSSDGGALVNALAPHTKLRAARDALLPALPLTTEQLDALQKRADECADTSAGAVIVDVLRIHGRRARFDALFDGDDRALDVRRCWLALHVVEEGSLKQERTLVERALAILEHLAAHTHDDDVKRRASYAATVNATRLRKKKPAASARKTAR